MWNLPNILTLSRLLSIPFFAYLAVSESVVMQLLAAVVFGLAALTDWLDGYLARRLNQMSDFGVMLDPFVDRVVVAAGLTVLYIKISQFVPIWMLLLVVGRDLIMLLGWLLLRKKSFKMQVAYIGKVATAFLMSSMYVLLFAPVFNLTILVYMALAAFYIGVFLSVYSGILYIRTGIDVLRKNPA